jgi:phage-related protein (TIGR01555 family)
MSDNPTAELLDLMRTDAGEILSAIEGALGNQRTGMGTANSVFWGTSVGMAPLLREQELRALYRSNWLIRRIIDVPAEDMTKNSVEVVLSDDGDEEDATKAMTLYQDSNPVDSPFESEYTLDQARYDSIRWARLFGRAYIVVHVNGGEDPSKPLRRVKSFDGVTVLDRFQLSPAPGEYNRYNPEFYTLGTFQEDIDSSRARKVPFGWGQRIHRSRVLPFDGNRIHPADVQLDGDAGHDSVIQNLYDIFVRHFTAREGLSEGLASYSLFVATINGLSNLLSTPNGETALRRYLQTLNQQKSVYRTVVRDGEAGSADFVERTFAGVGEVMGQIVNELTAATGLPHYKIWGHEANTNALSQGGTESRAYASQVNSWQKRDLAPNDRRLFKMLFQVATGDIPAFNLEYPTIYEPTPQELAELEAQQAATLKIYWEMGAILPAHAALIRATGQDIETVLDADEIRKQLERQKKELLKHEGFMQAETIRKAIADRFEVLRRAEGITKDQLHHAIATGQDLQDFLKPLDPERLEFPAEEDPEGEGADPNIALESLFGGEDAAAVEESLVEAPTEPEPDEVVQTDAIDLTPPQFVREAFQRAVRAYDEGTINPGDGLEPATVREARSIARGEAVSEAKVRKAYQWFARNSRFASAPKDSAAWAAWQLWGGQAFKGWVNGKYRELESRQDADELRGDARKGTGKACGASYIARWKVCRSGPGGRPVTEIVGVSDRLQQLEVTDKFISEHEGIPAYADLVTSMREGQKRTNDEIEDLVQIANIEYGERQRQENPDNWKSLKKVAEESGIDSRQLLEWTYSLDDLDEDSPIFEAPNGKRWMLANEATGFRQKFIDVPEHWNPGLGQWDLPDYDYKNFDTHLPEWIDSYKNLLRQQGRMDSAMPREMLGGIREITLDDLAQYRVNEETKADALPTAGATVSWQWGEGTAYGKVAEVFPRRVQRTIQGSKVVRRGTEDNPALLIEQEDGSTALKLASEVLVGTDGALLPRTLDLRLDKPVSRAGPVELPALLRQRNVGLDGDAPIRGDAVPRYEPADLDTLTPGEAQSILNALDTDAEVTAFLESLPPELAATLLQAESSEDDLAESLVLFVGQGVLALALWNGLRYQTMRVSVPEGWQELGEIERIGRAQRAIASAERRTITDEELGQQRDDIDAIYRLRAQKHADDLLGERITLEQFHQRMIDEIKQAHTVQRKLGQGRLGPQDKVSLRRDIDEQLGHLQKFIDQIRGGTQTPKQIRDRAGRYGGNGGYSFNQARGAVAEAMGGLYAERELGNCSPHCWDCLEYASRPRLPLREVPRPRESCRCGPNCCCRQVVYASLSDSLPLMVIH